MRAQTNLDFAVGIGVFLVTLAFAFTFMPSIFEPFTANSGASATIADRSAARVADDLLVTNTSRPAALDRDCTHAFFDGAPGDGGCGFEDDLRTALGVSATTHVNVTVEDAAGVHVLNGTRLAVGPAPAAGDGPVTARRRVLLEGRQFDLAVRVW